MKSGKFLAFNRRVLNAALASAVALGSVGVVGNAYAAVGTGVSTATVVPAITISASQRDLAFGRFLIDATVGGGTVIMSSASTGVRTKTGTGLTLVAATPGNSGQFTVTGDGGATYSIAVAQTTALTSGANTMNASTFTTTPSTPGTLSGTTGTSGTQIVYIGATLTVAASQAAGLYTGAYTVTVDYN